MADYYAHKLHATTHKTAYDDANLAVARECTHSLHCLISLARFIIFAWGFRKRQQHQTNNTRVTATELCCCCCDCHDCCNFHFDRFGIIFRHFGTRTRPLWEAESVNQGRTSPSKIWYVRNIRLALDKWLIILKECLMENLRLKLTFDRNSSSARSGGTHDAGLRGLLN